MAVSRTRPEIGLGSNPVPDALYPSVVFHGERACEREGCQNRAYYAVCSVLLCGVHSKRDNARRRELPKDPEAKRKRADALAGHEALALTVFPASPRPGRLRCHRLLMMRPVPLTDRWLNVFPNRKHAGRSDGRGMPALSPMCLGPVVHRQPGLPPSKNIENYHQANKCWSCELAVPLVDYKVGTPLDRLPAPSAEWRARQLDMYNDPEPHRHKFDKETMKKLHAAVPKGLSQNSPVYSVHLTLDGSERRFTYVESRYFYCCAYERLARETDAYRQLSAWYLEGVDIQLCGYDAHEMGVNATADELYEHYCNPALPFGHERVLYALLRLESEGPAAYPWHRYRRNHAVRYENIAHHETLVD